MYLDKTVVVVVPAYNEEKLIGRVIDEMPKIVDKIVICNDCSTDNTSAVVNRFIEEGNKRLELIDLKFNQGVGGAIAAGYKWARDNDYDIAVVMAGDAQMNPDDLPAVLDPVAKGEVNYSKGNRLFTGEAFKKIPKIRYFGNSALSLLTKIASGYWHVADSQTGYTAIDKKALHTINWDRMFRRYGQPNDLLVSLNIYNFKVRDVPVEPVYNVGEVSGIKVRKVVFTIGWLLVKLFFKRMKEKYVIRDFHPLIFFYGVGVSLLLISVPLLLRIVYMTLETGIIPKTNFLAFMFCAIIGVQNTLFAMWFDMESNKHLQ
ncbi:MAG: glycosyltransferase family 2 protein [Pseudobacteriovorax sp.]|nr:glycosyltransferase family 2 protein [Pseudobacteriovorax sp.]